MHRSAPRRLALAAAAGALALASISPVSAADDAMVRVLHASPDGPNVDVYVDDASVLTDVPFKALSDYVALPAGEHQVKVTPTGDAATAVIDAAVTVEAGTKYTIAAINPVASIEAKVLVDDPSPTSDGSLVRIVHLSPDAGPVDIAPDGGDALVEGLAFPDDTGYVELAAGSYDLEVRAAGTDTVALDLPAITVEAGTAYSVFAVGSAEAGSLDAVIGVDGMAAPATDTVAAGSAPAVPVAALAVAGLLAALAAVATVRRLATARATR
jgi:Domain of unknown function (DUF4397)